MSAMTILICTLFAITSFCFTRGEDVVKQIRVTTSTFIVAAKSLFFIYGVIVAGKDDMLGFREPMITAMLLIGLGLATRKFAFVVYDEMPRRAKEKRSLRR